MYKFFFEQDILRVNKFHGFIFFYLLSTGNLQTKETHAQEILKTKKQKNSNYRLFFSISVLALSSLSAT